MTSPVPSQVRVVRIYSGAQMLSTRGVTPIVPLRWPSRNPLDSDWYWIDATGWLTDPVGTAWDTIGQIARPIAIPDPALSITGTVISTDGMQAGIYFAGGTPGATPVIRIVLTGATTDAQKGLDIALPIQDVAPVQANPAGEATLHRSVVTIGGIRFPIPS